jgi:transcriptional regulator with PAS, ATPase and Fis domain
MRVLLIAGSTTSGSSLSRRLGEFAASVVHATSRESALRELRDPSFRLVVIDMSAKFAEELAMAGARTPRPRGPTVIHVYGPSTAATTASADRPLAEAPHAGVRSDPDETFIGCSAGVLEVRDLVERYGAGEACVLICGETGTGKELVAHAVHRASARRAGPFVPVNCAAIAASIFESEVFGSVRGAFTGAVRDHGGLIGAARGGTLFLDEVGELSLALQAKLLRLLEDGSYRRVGATHEAKADVRVVAATNRDLLTASEAGTFRTDLFFRLDVLRITIPPLRERRGDIPLLANHFLSTLARGRSLRQPTSGALRQLVAYPWPGNVRELKHTVERTLAHRAFSYWRRSHRAL